MMRSLSSLYGCAAAVFLVVLYFFYQQRSMGFESTMHSASQGTAHRVVVFGDDWSDTGYYRVSPPPPLSIAARDPDRGELWTETLCKELACDHVDNFARSIPIGFDNGTVGGAVIDADIYSQALTRNSNDGITTDFKTQMQEFLKYEERYRIPQSLRTVDNWIVFTVFFGLWDLLKYSIVEIEIAMRAIDNSIAELFHQLDLLATLAPTPVKVILPLMMDITFLPRFQYTNNNTSEHAAELQQHGVFLSAYWNVVLLRSATQWQHGEIFTPDLNAVVTEQVRAKQLHSEGIIDASGAGKNMPLFEHVEQPCLTMSSDSNTKDLQAAVVEKCSNPATHLFWDAVHLGPIFHQLIGRKAADLIRSNQTVNIESHASELKPEGQHSRSFNMKFPPGY